MFIGLINQQLFDRSVGNGSNKDNFVVKLGKEQKNCCKSNTIFRIFQAKFSFHRKLYS